MTKIKKERTNRDFLLTKEIIEGMKECGNVNWSSFIRDCLKMKIEQVRKENEKLKEVFNDK